MGFLAMYEGLKHAFADFSIVGAPLVPRASATAAFEHYRAIETEFNTQLPPPPRVLNQLVEDLLTEAKVEPARRAYAWLVEGYGPQRNQQELEQMIARIAALPPLKETVEQLAATPLPSPREISPYVGLWKGEGWLNEHTRWPMTLRIAVKDGKVIAETEGWGPPGEFRPVDFLKIVPGGIEFGNMNGMRPKGMIVNSGTLKGATIEGEGQFRGIVLPLPRGHMPPVTKFRLVKTG
jgi:hypothetical protein